MQRAKLILAWLLGLALLLVLLADFLWAFLLFDAYRHGGIQGVRDHLSFSHLRFDVRPRSAEELVHEAQKGYEISALLTGSLVILTWLGLRAYKRVNEHMPRHQKKGCDPI